jgi:hypothetical protein
VQEGGLQEQWSVVARDVEAFALDGVGSTAVTPNLRKT